jgi:hypothetical protein
MRVSNQTSFARFVRSRRGIVSQQATFTHNLTLMGNFRNNQGNSRNNIIANFNAKP